MLLLFPDIVEHFLEGEKIGAEHGGVINLWYLLHHEVFKLIEADHHLTLEVVMPFIVVSNYLL